MNHIGLFEGIGGFSLAARWMGWETIAWCEINPFCQQVLKHHFPKAQPHDDIKTTDFTVYRGKCDILTGGFPCQPFSAAGKRLGTEDDRHLWPEMLRAIREIQPRWVVGENVRGLVNWSEGMVFEQVQADLEAIGYEIQPFLLPACAVNAPHRRDRIWFVAYAKCSRHRGFAKESGSNITKPIGRILSNIRHNGDKIWCETERCSKASTNPNITPTKYAVQTGRYVLTGEDATGTTSNAENTGQPSCTTGQRQKQLRGRNFTMGARQWDRFPTQSPVCSGNDGIPRGLDGITFPKWRNESIKAYGNAVVPQVVIQIFKSIEQYESLQ